MYLSSDNCTQFIPHHCTAIAHYNRFFDTGMFKCVLLYLFIDCTDCWVTHLFRKIAAHRISDVDNERTIECKCI